MYDVFMCRIASLNELFFIFYFFIRKSFRKKKRKLYGYLPLGTIIDISDGHDGYRRSRTRNTNKKQRRRECVVEVIVKEYLTTAVFAGAVAHKL